MTVNNKICCSCQNTNSSYKCPICRTPYCSLACYKNHKTTPCIPKEVTPQQMAKSKEYEFPTEDTVPISKLENLKNSEEIRNCLKNPHLKNIIQTILKSENPTETIAQAMVEPIFVELADACLKVVD